jgi:hypothetical protein
MKEKDPMGKLSAGGKMKLETKYINLIRKRVSKRQKRNTCGA